MKLTRVIAVAVIAASSALGVAQAKSLKNVRVPAEFPPASYEGRQYVDSNGCVFVRAGIDGNVSWVPRVSRDRKVICGFQPSIAGAKPVDEPPAQVAAAPKPKAKVEPPKPKPLPAKPKPQPVVVAQSVPVQPARTKPVAVVRKPAPAQPVALAPVKIVRVPVQTQPASQPVQTAVVKVKPVKTINAQPKIAARPQQMAPRQSACRGASAISSKYLTAHRGLPVRCGPQDSSHVGVLNGGQAYNVVKVQPAPVAVQPSYTQPVPLRRTAAYAAPAPVRIAPSSTYQQQVSTTRRVHIPAGYKPAWTDDRLNPKRGHQTARGKAQMELVWTNTVPRYLVDRNTGREVTYQYPGLQYPYVSFAEQQAAQVTISTKGSVPQQRAVQTRARSATKAVRSKHEVQSAASESRTVRRAAKAPKVTVSTRSTVRKTQQTPAPASHRYVQAGMFSNPDNARRAAQRIANAGLPARLGKSTRGGKTYSVVVAGPFGSQGQLNGALQRVRGLGFGDAFLRR